MYINLLFKVHSYNDTSAALKVRKVLSEYSEAREDFTNELSVPFERFYDWFISEDIGLDVYSKQLKFEMLPTNDITDRMADVADLFVEMFCKDQFRSFVETKKHCNYRVNLHTLDFDQPENGYIKVRVKYTISVGNWESGWMGQHSQGVLPEILDLSKDLLEEIPYVPAIKKFVTYLISEDNDFEAVPPGTDREIIQFLKKEKNTYLISAIARV